MITVTKSAEDHISKYLQSRKKGEAIRIGLKASGCSGMSYVLEFVDDLSKLNIDDSVHTSGTVSVVIDGKSLPFLEGMELDYVREGLQEGFKFNNPNVGEQCGCGKSFNV